MQGAFVAFVTRQKPAVASEAGEGPRGDGERGGGGDGGERGGGGGRRRGGRRRLRGGEDEAAQGKRGGGAFGANARGATTGGPPPTRRETDGRDAHARRAAETTTCGERDSPCSLIPLMRYHWPQVSLSGLQQHWRSQRRRLCQEARRTRRRASITACELFRRGARGLGPHSRHSRDFSTPQSSLPSCLDASGSGRRCMSDTQLTRSTFCSIRHRRCSC